MSAVTETAHRMPPHAAAAAAGRRRHQNGAPLSAGRRSVAEAPVPKSQLHLAPRGHAAALVEAVQAAVAAGAERERRRQHDGARAALLDRLRGKAATEGGRDCRSCDSECGQNDKLRGESSESGGAAPAGGCEGRFCKMQPISIQITSISKAVRTGIAPPSPSSARSKPPPGIVRSFSPTKNLNPCEPSNTRPPVVFV